MLLKLFSLTSISDGSFLFYLLVLSLFLMSSTLSMSISFGFMKVVFVFSLLVSRSLYSNSISGKILTDCKYSDVFWMLTWSLREYGVQRGTLTWSDIEMNEVC